MKSERPSRPPKQQAVYKLVPNGHTCKACGKHDVNSLFPTVAPYKVDICLVIIVLITVANLRGVREAGNIFAVPTYLFIFGILVMIGIGPTTRG